MQIYRRENIPFLIIIVLVATVLILAGQNYSERRDLIVAQNTIKTFQYNQKILDFTTMFITKVLKADGEVSFEDRLNLENTVRNIDDKTIFDQWQKFVNAKNEIEAQIEVKNLLELLINKITL